MNIIYSLNAYILRSYFRFMVNDAYLVERVGIATNIANSSTALGFNARDEQLLTLNKLVVQQ